jgi:hypothetical protein
MALEKKQGASAVPSEIVAFLFNSAHATGRFGAAEAPQARH